MVAGVPWTLAVPQIVPMPTHHDMKSRVKQM